MTTIDNMQQKYYAVCIKGDTMLNLGRYIKQKRLTIGLSQKELGTLCKISDASIQRIESGKIKYPNWNILCRVAEAVKTHPFEILKRAGYITDTDINPIHKLNGLEKLTISELQSVQFYVDFIIFKRNNHNNKLRK